VVPHDKRRLVGSSNVSDEFGIPIGNRRRFNRKIKALGGGQRGVVFALALVAVAWRGGDDPSRGCQAAA
jgi:hypothetical protein